MSDLDLQLRRVLMTTDTVGGVFTYCLTLAAELACHGVEVHLATLGPSSNIEQREAVREIPGLVLHENDRHWALEWMDEPWADVVRSGEWLLDLEADVCPDIVHINGYAHGALEFRAPKIVVAHSCVLSWWRAVHGAAAPGRYDIYKRAVSTGIASADAVVAISAAMRACIEEHYFSPLCSSPYNTRSNTSGIDVVYNGIAPVAPNSKTRFDRLASNKEPFVLSCGRVWDRAKNIEALTRVAHRLPWPVKIAGWEADRSADCADEGGSGDDHRRKNNVQSLGWLGAHDLQAVMDRAAVFALPARYEPFGRSALEAATRGAALVLGDIPSQREIWGDAALFVDPSDDDALADALLRMTTDQRLRSEFAERARLRAYRYRAAKMASEMIGIYAKAKGNALAKRKRESTAPEHHHSLLPTNATSNASSNERSASSSSELGTKRDQNRSCA